MTRGGERRMAGLDLKLVNADITQEDYDAQVALLLVTTEF